MREKEREQIPLFSFSFFPFNIKKHQKRLNGKKEYAPKHINKEAEEIHKEKK